ncbi:MAG: lipolytic protein G-D-S-L family [Bacteroidetes bacterium]|nr:lipolytic protein G-D-S-L family [Bacteroidota bacterium]
MTTPFIRDYLKRARFLLPIAIFLFASCAQPTEPWEDPEALPAIDVPWTNQQSIVCFGTSLTNGFMWAQAIQPTGRDFHEPPQIPAFSNNQDNRLAGPHAYPELLAATLKMRVHNQGHVGATTQDALNIVGDSVFYRNPALVLLEFGANDFLQQISDSAVEKRLGRLIDTLHIFGSKVIFISFLNTGMIESLPSDHFLANRRQAARSTLEMLKRVTGTRNLLFVENAMKDIYWNKDRLSDALHPNKEGYRIMQENISRALAKTFSKNGMLNPY